MKTIFYDNQIFTAQKFGGISRYFCELIRHSHNLFNYSVGGIYCDNYYSKEMGFHKSFPIKQNFKGRNRVINYLNNKDSSRKLKKCDIFHSTYYDNYLLKNINKPTIITVYDMIHELFPKGFNNKLPNKKNDIEQSNNIIAISKCTKKDILEFYPYINPDKVTVIYLGTSWEIIKDKKFLKNEQDYLLFTGDRTFYKNFNNFILAVAPLLNKYNLHLKCTGKPFTESEIELIKQQKIFDKCSIQFANEDELKLLYANSLCFVFPSLYEGFGIPILESFACGCPLVLSNASCFPEIAADAGLYFDPNSIEDMRQKIDNIICSETMRRELITKGYERLKMFSWRKCAEETAKVYEKC